MIKVLEKIWNFSESEQNNIKKSIFLGLINAMFNALSFGAIFIVLTAIIEERKDSYIPWQAAGIMLISIVGRVITRYYSQLQRTHAGYFMVAKKRIHIGNKLKSVPMGYFNDNNLGKITGTSTTVLTDVENTAPMVLVLVLGGLLNSLVFAGSIFIFDWRIGLIVLVGMVTFLMTTSQIEKKTRICAPKRQQAQENLVGAVLETVQGMSVFKSFNMDDMNNNKIDRAIEDSCNRNYALEKAITPFSILQNSILKIASVAIIASSILFYLNGSMSISNFMMMIVASFIIFEPIETLGHSSAILRITGASIDMANELDNVPIMDEGGKQIQLGSHDIQFENVSFSYERKTILDNINLNIPDKTTTAIIGPSGSGKTTLCNLIARFWDVNNGKVLIGGHDVKSLTLESLMSNVSMVFQNVYLFEDTIENNIKFGKPEATHEQVVEAAKKACCDEFITELPNGYHTLIGEGGASLSGGEKQRISIARAMIKNAPIVIFDEATANVDPENEDRLKNAIGELTRDKTIIMIAHRLKTVKNADQIVVINEGKIVQKGKHEELIGEEGIYKRFVSERKEAVGWKLEIKE